MDKKGNTRLQIPQVLRQFQCTFKRTITELCPFKEKLRHRRNTPHCYIFSEINHAVHVHSLTHTRRHIVSIFSFIFVWFPAFVFGLLSFVFCLWSSVFSIQSPVSIFRRHNTIQHWKPTSVRSVQLTRKTKYLWCLNIVHNGWPLTLSKVDVDCCYLVVFLASVTFPCNFLRALALFIVRFIVVSTNVVSCCNLGPICRESHTMPFQQLEMIWCDITYSVKLFHRSASETS